ASFPPPATLRGNSRPLAGDCEFPHSLRACQNLALTSRMRSGFDVPPRRDLQLSVVIPVYNELETLPRILRAVALALPDVARQVVLVDDCSTDGTRQWIEATFPSADNRVAGVRWAENGEIEFLTEAQA